MPSRGNLTRSTSQTGFAFKNPRFLFSVHPAIGGDPLRCSIPRAKNKKRPFLAIFYFWCPREESNLNYKIRNLASYPLNDKGKLYRHKLILSLIRIVLLFAPTLALRNRRADFLRRLAVYRATPNYSTPPIGGPTYVGVK